MSQPEILRWERLEGSLDELRASFRSARPFPHVIVDDVLPEPSLARALAEFPKSDQGNWIHYRHYNEDKLGKNNRDELSAHWRRTIDEFQSARFVSWLTALTGIDGLIADEALEGGGLHVTEPGGFLNIHADFTVHPRHRKLRRRLNVLLYLNPEWDDAWGGALELWDRNMTRCEQRIVPSCNRLVVFATDRDSFHGHPAPLRCPPERARRSLALYYFTEEQRPYTRSTEYRARPSDGLRAGLIWADKMAVRAYDALKRRIPIDDAALSRVLRFLGGRRR